MSRYCQHDYVWGRCPRCEVSAQLGRLHAIYSVVPASPGALIRLNLDRAGLPRDYATYVWLLYKRVVADDSPARRAFLDHPGTGWRLPEADPLLMGTEWK